MTCLGYHTLSLKCADRVVFGGLVRVSLVKVGVTEVGGLDQDGVDGWMDF